VRLDCPRQAIDARKNKGVYQKTHPVGLLRRPAPALQQAVPGEARKIMRFTLSIPHSEELFVCPFGANRPGKTFPKNCFQSLAPNAYKCFMLESPCEIGIAFGNDIYAHIDKENG
jgi:hypothetical protein